MENTMYSYVGNVNTNLICCICTMPFLVPTCTTICSHTFCLSCISRALETTLQCPIDRSALTRQNLQPASQIVRNLVDELPVSCIHKESGCNLTLQRQLLAYHTKHECMFAQIKCCEEQCDQVFLKQDAEKHSAGCPHRLLKCKACDLSIKAKEMEAHENACTAREIACAHCTIVLERSFQSQHEAECLQARVSCPQSSNGCPWTDERYLLEEHTAACPYEAIKGFFSVNAARISTLEVENSKLRAQIGDMQRTLRAAERDLETARVSLGPWFRTAGTTRAVSSTEPPRRERIQRRRLSSPLNTSIFGFPAEGPVGPIGVDGSDDPFVQLPNPGPGSSQSYPDPAMLASLNEMSPSRFSFPPEGYPYQRIQGTSPVAPVDLNTTLEGSLSSLRGSVVQLSASLDALDSRQDIMLGTETLRRREEVGSLRAIVHGLRMQVHAILMERHNQISGGMNHPSTIPGATSSVTSTVTSGPAAASSSSHRQSHSLDDFSPEGVYLNQNTSRLGPLPFLSQQRRPPTENKL